MTSHILIRGGSSLCLWRECGSCPSTYHSPDAVNNNLHMDPLDFELDHVDLELENIVDLQEFFYPMDLNLVWR